MPQTIPIINAPIRLTNPAAGVIPTSPEIAPSQSPASVGFPVSYR